MSAAIGIDLGTTNLKVVAVDESGAVVDTARRRLVMIENGGRFEQDAESLWSVLADAIVEVATGAAAAGAPITSVGVCSQYSSIVPVDERIRPVGPMVMWRDHRGTGHSFDILGRDDDAFMTFVERHGIPPVGGGLSLGHLLALQIDEPDQHAATRWYLEPMDYVVGRLTGQAAVTQHSMFMSQVCDNRTLGQTTYDEVLLELSGVDPSRLAPLVDATDPVGTLDPAVADDLGLSADVIVYPGMNDTAAGGLAAGVHRSGIAGVAIGTTSVIVDSVAHHAVDLDHEILSMPGVGGEYLVWAENGLGGHVLDHVMRRFVHADDSPGASTDGESFAAFDETVDSVVAGSDGLLFLPWLSGSLAPSARPDMRGGYVNMSLESTQAHLVRAAAEGIAHNLAWLLGHVDTFVDEPAEELVFVGGVARSAAMCRILADVSGRSVGRVADPEYAVARAIARYSTSPCATPPDAVVDRFRPDPALHDRYVENQVRFERAHDAMSQILAPVPESDPHNDEAHSDEEEP